MGVFIAGAIGVLTALYATQLTQFVDVTFGPEATGLIGRGLRALYLPPTKLTWLLTWAAVWAVVAIPARIWAVRYAARRWRAQSARGRAVLAAGAVGWAGLVLAWWEYGLMDNQWVFAEGWRPVIETFRVLNGVIVAAAVAWSLLALTIDPHAPAVDPPAQAGWFGRANAVGLAVFAAAGVGLAVWFVRAERTVYFWDYGGYWSWTAGVAEMMRASPEFVWGHVRTSIKYGAYNLIPAVGPGAVMSAAGTGRLVYVLSVFCLYGIAVAVVLSSAVRAIGRHWPGRPSAAVGLVPAAVLFGMPMLWAGTLRGMPDVGGVALGLGILGVYLSRPWADLRWPQWVAIAGMLAALSLFRRWYNIWVLAFLLVVAVESAIGIIAIWRRDGVRAAFRAAVPVAAVPVVFLAAIASVAWPVLAELATANVARDYVGYKLPLPFWTRLGLMSSAIGWLPVLTAGVGGLVLLADRRTRRAAVVPMAMLPVLVYELLKVHDPAVHHFGLYMPTLVLLAAAGLTRSALAVPAWPRAGLAVALVAVSVLPPAGVFVPAAAPLRESATPWLPDRPFYPLVREDADELARLMTDLDARVGPGQTFAVLASSTEFNQTTMMVAGQSLGVSFDTNGRIRGMPEVDRRDGFPGELFLADYVVVADPPQYHIRPEEQQTVIIPARSVLDGTDVGAAFVRLPGEYALGDGVTVFVYRRDRDPTPAEMAAFCSKLKAAQPDFPKVWAR